MNQLLNELSSFSIVLPLVVGLVRRQTANNIYYPFFFLLFLGLCNEVASVILIKGGHSNAFSTNIYLLLESWLITYQLKKWGLFGLKSWQFYTLIFFFLVAWAIEILLTRITTFASCFIIIHAFIVVLLSISMTNRLLTEENIYLRRHPVFMICMGFILYFTIAMLAEAFYLYGIRGSNDFQVYVLRIAVFINLPVNLLFAIAALWIPRKPIRSYSP